MCSLKNPDRRRSVRKRAESQNRETLSRIERAVTKELPSGDGVEDRDTVGQESILTLPHRPTDYRSDSQRLRAIDTIRRFRSLTGLTVRFSEIALNPYLNGIRTMEIYEDENGYEYWVDPRNDRLIQAAPAAGQPASAYQVRPEDRLPVAELRRIAIDTIKSNFPEFPDHVSAYHPLEDNRNREVYFFRFDDPCRPVPESELPPFVQVGLRADGKLVSFTDTMVRPVGNADRDRPET